MLIDLPQSNPGSPEQRRANFDTHHWANWDGEWMCSDCDCKPWHIGAQWPCGVPVPREQVEVATLPEAWGYASR